MAEKELENPFKKIDREIEKALEAHGYTDQISENEFLEKIWPQVEEKAKRILEEARQDALKAPKSGIITSPVAAALILDHGARTLEDRIRCAPFLTIEAGEFQKMPLPEKKMILHPWLDERSLTLLSGDTGVGKSIFTLSLAEAIVRGEKFAL